MPTVTTNIFRQSLALETITLSADTFTIALMYNYIPDNTSSTLKKITNWSQVSSYEALGTNYTAADLSGSSVGTVTATDTVYWDGNNITWNNITTTTDGLCVYRSSDGLVVGFVEFSQDYAPVNGTFSIGWNTLGLMNIV